MHGDSPDGRDTVPRIELRRIISVDSWVWARKVISGKLTKLLLGLATHVLSSRAIATISAAEIHQCARVAEARRGFVAGEKKMFRRKEIRGTTMGPSGLGLPRQCGPAVGLGDHGRYLRRVVKRIRIYADPLIAHVSLRSGHANKTLT